ncbi:alanine racemase [Agreia sp. VKM Ac-1783]|uniref:alanine racemase n=1 Tax=Agreia sp. VKM Ac-1783 TaxID=1938889 RepID=UPI000A2ADA74|nr:alanine racemase [Agreia sp. VKM Ac-1783]SMQ67891.1 alanine racemase [Agreia sp. VKM Ac-1783]
MTIPTGEILIDLEALRHNIDVLTAQVAPSQVMVVVKNDAYGHGLIDVTRAAVDSGVSWIGALDLPTALSLRDAGVSSPTRIFAWLLDPEEDLAPAIAASVDLGISTVAQLNTIAASQAANPARVHLKIDTGLHRNGATPEDWPGLVARARDLEDQGVVEIVAVWTHIAEADDHEDSLSIARFEDAVAIARDLGVRAPLRHLAASAAGFARSDARFDLVRFGAFVYGLPPGDGPSAESMGLRQVMTLRAPISLIEALPDGRRRASIDLGFADGLSTSAPGRIAVAIDGRRHPLVGPLEVDRAWIALDDDSDVAVGDTVTVWGDGSAGEQTLQEWGNATDTMSEELVVRLSPRIPRRLV